VDAVAVDNTTMHVRPIVVLLDSFLGHRMIVILHVLVFVFFSRSGVVPRKSLIEGNFACLREFVDGSRIFFNICCVAFLKLKRFAAIHLIGRNSLAEKDFFYYTADI
jgi:hypothetical protein